MGLLSRLTHEQDPIRLHGFNSSIREYARGKKTKLELETCYGIDSTDAQWRSLVGLIDAESTATTKTIKAIEIGDVLIIHEGVDSSSLYPTGVSIKNRFGI